MAGIEPVYVCFPYEGAPSADNNRNICERHAPHEFRSRRRIPKRDTGPQPAGYLNPGLYATAVWMQGMADATRE